MKMYAIFARDAIQLMGGNRGKLASQAGHAFLHSFWDGEEQVYDTTGKTKRITDFGAYRNVLTAYRASGKAKKITLVVDTVSELEALRDAYRSICGVSLVTDAGLTCFDGPTTTCLGIGPIRDEDIGQDLKDLRVLI